MKMYNVFKQPIMAEICFIEKILCPWLAIEKLAIRDTSKTRCLSYDNWPFREQITNMRAAIKDINMEEIRHA